MGKRWRQYFNTNSLLMLAAIVACAGYLLLLYQGHARQQNYTAHISSLEQSQQALQRELASKRYTHDRLQRELSSAAKRSTELQSELDAVLAQDWQNRFAALQSDKQLLEQQQYSNTAEIDRLNRAISFLHQNNESLRTELELSMTGQQDLTAEFIAARQAWETEQRKLEQKLKQAHKQTTNPESVSINNPEPVSTENKSAAAGTKLDLKITDIDIAAPAGDSETTVYRQVRLQSLTHAMRGQSSSNRRNILTSVLATVPGGFTGEELLPLISGMDSSDILLLLQSTNQYLLRPLDQKILQALFASMSDVDAKTAQNILVKN